MTAAEALRALAEEYWEGVLRRNPTLATFYGDYRYNDRLPDVGPEGRAEEEADLRSVLDRLQAIPQDDLSTDDRVTWDMLRLAVESGLDALRLRLDEMAVDQMGGPQVWLFELLNWHPLDTPEHVDQLIARYHAFPRYMGQYLDALRDGVRDRRTAPAIAVEGAVYPAYREMLDYLAGEYLQRDARREPGVWSVADGEEIYAILARQHTTTDLTPQQLHQIGLDDLQGIHAEMRAIMERSGDSSGNIRAFTERLTRDPANLSASREEILERSNALLAEAKAALPRAFGHLPKTEVIVRAIEDYRERDAVAAFYYQPSADGSRPGVFYVNTFEPSSRPRHTLPALVFHESVPGHHLQIAIAQEAADLPTFRRLSAGWLTNAFVEGWGLYSERLGDELGLYPDDLARYGMLGYQAWRACRLVVDTGMHHLHWSRQQAIDFFYENVGLTERETVNEVDRYIIWPGQALSYKTGQREIEAARREAERQLGQKFNLRAFHDELLCHAALPLTTMRRTMTDWAARIGS